MAWRVARSLDRLLAQLNAAAPRRSKVSDGSIGDAAHASRTSDHNPWVKDGAMGVVTARDYTHDPANGMDCERLYQALVRSRDPRIKYIIWNRTITSGNGQTSPWVRRAYTGSNAHTKHLHLSVHSSKALYDDVRDWSTGLGGGAPTPTPAPPSGDQPWLRLPAVRSRPRSFQQWYNAYPFKPALLPVISPLADTFGPQSEAALKKVQARYGLEADGIDGPKTKKLLWDLGWRG